MSIIDTYFGNGITYTFEKHHIFKRLTKLQTTPKARLQTFVPIIKKNLEKLLT